MCGAGTAESSVRGEKWSLDAPESKACPDAVGSHPCQRRWGELRAKVRSHPVT